MIPAVTNRDVFNPFPHQHLILAFDKLAKFDEYTECKTVHMCGHRRSGKTVGGAYGMLLRASAIMQEREIFKIKGKTDSRNPRMTFMAETKENARNIAWADLKHAFNRYGKGVKYDNVRLAISLERPWLGDKLEILLMALRDHDKLRGMEFRYAHLDEVQVITEQALNRSIFPVLHSINGEVLTTGTATSVGYYQSMLKGACERGTPTWIVPASKTKVFTKSDLTSFRAQMGEFGYFQEYECDFSVSTSTAFFRDSLVGLETGKRGFLGSKASPGGIKTLAVDVGVADGFAAWLLDVEDKARINVLDYFHGYELTGPLKKDIEERHGPVDCYIVPHDVHTRRLESVRSRSAMDVFRETFPDACPIPIEKPKKNMKFAEIERTHKNLHMLSFPSLDSGGEAHHGMSLLKKYRRVETKDGYPTDVVYKHDGSSHAGDALVHAFTGLDVRDGLVMKMPTWKAGGNSGVNVSSLGRSAWGKPMNVGLGKDFLLGSGNGGHGKFGTGVRGSSFPKRPDFSGPEEAQGQGSGQVRSQRHAERVEV